MLSPWKRIRHRLESLGCLLLERLIPLLSRRACVKISGLLGALAYHLDRRGAAVALANLEAAFGDTYSPDERKRIARASYQNFARTMFDLFWAPRLTRSNFRESLPIEGFDAVRERITRENRGVVFLSSHHANWEWSSLSVGFAGYPILAVAEQFKNPLLEASFTRLRQVSDVQIIRQENSMLRMFKTVKRGGSAALLLDLTLHPSQAATVIEGFGMKMCVSMLHAVLAERTGALLVYVETRPQPDGSCSSVASPIEVPPNATVQEIAQRCWDVLEEIIRKDPGRWLWAYKHWRYKPKDATRQYPFYANVSSKFEKLLRTQTSDAPQR